MNKRALGALIALNVVLLVALVVSSLTTTPARAQGARNPGVYSMVAGPVTGGGTSVTIYLMEQGSTKVLPLMYNSADNSLNVVQGRTITDDLQP